jgi:tetratricopeptide (TPR) repeat protein
MASDKSRKRFQELVEPPSKQSDWSALVQHIRAKPLLYAVSVAFVVFSGLVGLLYQVSRAGSEREMTTRYASALETEDPGLRVAELEQVAAEGKIAPHVMYMTAEGAYHAKEYDKAKAAFERLRAEYPESDLAPEAVEGLGYVAEEQKEDERAQAYYQEILDKWPASFAGRRQPLNIARCQERLGRLSDAVASYKREVEMFPGSYAASAAQAALDRLRKEHKDLFPEPAQEAQQAAKSALEAVSASDTSQTPTTPPQSDVVSPGTDSGSESVSSETPPSSGPA